MPKDLSKLFDGCTVALVPSRRLQENTLLALGDTIKSHGGQVLANLAGGGIDVENATHIVANSIDFPEFDEAMARMIPVVTDGWINVSIGKGKQSQLRPYSPDPRMIFSKIHITCADIPSSDTEAIIGATMALGGMESKDLTKATTHICALSMDHPKCQLALERNFPCKIVLPHWFDDCFKLGKKIDETPYLLPNPPILDGFTGDVPVPPTQSLAGATSDMPVDMEVANSDREKCTVFDGKRVMLSADLQMSARFHPIVTKIITDGGGEVVDNVEACDMFICKYRDGPQYVHAAQARKHVGSLAWLFYLITHNEWCSPLRRLLHYPVPRDGIPGFQDLKITVSNYGGEARIYLENLIKATGATFTKTMKSENTHLISARKGGEKCLAAKEWGVNMVNHLWVEESYARCEALELTSQRFTTFPEKTNLGEVIGQTFFDESTLRNKYYPGGEEPTSAAPKRKRKTRAPIPTPEEDDEAEEAEQLDVLKDDDVAKSKPGRKFATPARPRHLPTGKENDASSVVSSGSRSAKDKALSRLHGMAGDIALYEKEKKRMSKDASAPWGGKRAADELDKAREAEKNSSPTPATGADDEDVENEDELAKRPVKKAKKSLPPAEMRIVCTGYQRWVGKSVMMEDGERKKLRRLGISIVQENQQCDYLAAPMIVRTKKFLQVLARGPQVINTTFLDDVLEQGKMLPVENYLLKDKDNEKKFKFSVQEAVSRARALKGKLLTGVPIYCTEHVPNNDSFKDIAVANGAIFMLYRARSGTTIKPTTRDEDGGADPEPVYLLSGTSANDKLLWARFTKMAKQGNMEPRIVTTDWLLDVAMRQEIQFNQDYLAENNK